MMMTYQSDKKARGIHAWLAVLAILCLFIGGCGGSSSTNADFGGPSLQATTASNVSLATTNVSAAVLRRPVNSADSHIGIVIMHPYSSYTGFQGCDELAKRGFTTLCVNSEFTGRQLDYYGYEQHVPAIRAAILQLRAMPNITKVLLFGHSMGAPMMAFYQNVAENGAGVCTGPEKLIPCVTTNLRNLPVADLGESLATFTYVDPAVINNTLGARDPSLDMFSPANGYNTATNGAVYSDQFRQRFLAAQAARNKQLNDQALSLLAQKRAATGDPTQMGDDIPFRVVGATSARLFQPDVNLLKCTQEPVTLLARDNSRPSQIVCSVRPPSGNAAEALGANSVINTNVHIWLGAHGLRSTSAYNQTSNDITGIDYTSTATSTVGNIPGVTKPMLIVANGGHYFLRPDEIVFNAARMTDKTFAITEGAVHGGTECTACETLLGLPTPAGAGAFGYYGDSFSRTMNFMAQWLRSRY
jgi:pimeloyl-ACP methyl ester carboxylesterase